MGSRHGQPTHDPSHGRRRLDGFRHAVLHRVPSHLAWPHDASRGCYVWVQRTVAKPSHEIDAQFVFQDRVVREGWVDQCGTRPRVIIVQQRDSRPGAPRAFHLDGRRPAPSHSDWPAAVWADDNITSAIPAARVRERFRNSIVPPLACNHSIRSVAAGIRCTVDHDDVLRCSGGARGREAVRRKRDPSCSRSVVAANETVGCGSADVTGTADGPPDDMAPVSTQRAGCPSQRASGSMCCMNAEAVPETWKRATW